MSEMVQHFISELIRAANEIDKLTKREQANLLRRAAGTISDIRYLISSSGAPAKAENTPNDIVYCLHEMARTIESLPSDHVSDAMLEAAESIKAGRILLDAEREFQSRPPATKTDEKQMTYTTGMQLNKLGYDSEREVVEFSMRKSFDSKAIVIQGEVPMMTINPAGLRIAAKAAVRQALLDAADALSDQADASGVDEGLHPEDLNASNDD